MKKSNVAGLIVIALFVIGIAAALMQYKREQTALEQPEVGEEPETVVLSADENPFGIEIKKINENLENARIQELIDLLGSKRKIFIRNLIAGISKGLGFSIGFYLITALLIYLLQYIVKLNIPIIGKYISDIVDIVELNRK